MSFEATAIATLVAGVLYMLVFVVMLSTRKRSERRRDRRMLVGIALQVLGFVVVPANLRPTGSPLVPTNWAYSDALEQVVRITTIALAYASLWFTWSAIRTLGKQWSLSARVVEDHQLIRNGPYALVRHPIYTGLLGMNIAYAMTFTSWAGVIAAIALSALGSWIRVNSEEHLMRQTFGDEYASYAQAVPALVPWLRLRRSPPNSA